MVHSRFDYKYRRKGGKEKGREREREGGIKG